ncbi:hypothetical protein LAU_0256 [Lausannevirus]|uniref:MORN repeat-containing protein n=1 Tax=Lausannevirus TaxID=999883 RepID=F2WLI4_9VIRU|nr:hypothetical protein LAU_0256 [Lausannevirus]AEA07107.1 hypothetical protein LAU_0256 [Lausannevirus]
MDKIFQENIYCGMQKFLEKREVASLCLSFREDPEPERFCEKISLKNTEFYVLPDGTKHGLWRELEERTEIRKTYKFGVLEGSYVYFDWTWGTIATGNFLNGKPHGVFVLKKGCSVVYEHGKMTEHTCRGSTCDLMCSRDGTKSKLEWKWEDDAIIVAQTSSKRGEKETRQTIRYSCLSFVEEMREGYEFFDDGENTDPIPDCFLGTHLSLPIYNVPMIRIIAKKYKHQNREYRSSRGWTLPYFLY